MSREDQKSIHTWCKETFPRHVGKKGRAIALLEEAAELALAAGVGFDTIRQAVEVPIKKHVIRTKAGEPLESDAGEIADVLLCLYAYAEEASIDAHGELDAKMRENRSRSTSYYAAKTAAKEAMGFILEDAPVQVCSECDQPLPHAPSSSCIVNMTNEDDSLRFGF